MDETIVQVAKDRKRAQEAALPESLVDWLTVNDAPPEMWAEAIEQWHEHGYWQSPTGNCWGELKPEPRSGGPDVERSAAE